MPNVSDVAGQGSAPPAPRLLIVSNGCKQRGKCRPCWPGTGRLRRDGRRLCPPCPPGVGGEERGVGGWGWGGRNLSFPSRCGDSRGQPCERCRGRTTLWWTLAGCVCALSTVGSRAQGPGFLLGPADAEIKIPSVGEPKRSECVWFCCCCCCRGRRGCCCLTSSSQKLSTVVS